MPRWQKRVHQFRVGVLWFIFGTLSVFQLYSLSHSSDLQAIRGWLVISLGWIAIAATAIGMQFSLWRRLVSEFTYDGSAFKFRTLGRQDEQVRAAGEIENITLWRGRGQPLGYLLLFTDGQKAYLQRSVSNATPLAAEITRVLRSRP
jgi:hypothetical protein